ncbi:Fatty acid oxidation complex subunit alpha [Streptomyces sp. RB17]|nr:3-hydroxyacyl-CoA dehydrogenase NAD-binding domain-containing protein [Streptomyces sp. RB17]MQY36664.1 Fatty acid oxidation complex subunit alpha [Streptomyces sp. RB17]
MTGIERVGVVGRGLMGAGIAEVCARAGLPVTVVERDAQAALSGGLRIARSLDRATAQGRLTEQRREAIAARIAVVDRIEALHDRDLVIEAVAEDERLKADVLTRLDSVLTDERTLVATNTSSIPVVRLASATGRPENVVGVHFFNPVPVLRLVELVPSLLTSPDTVARAESFVTATLGKSGRRSSGPGTRPASSSMRCSCRTCWRRSARWSRVVPAPRTSTARWSWGAPTRSARRR